MTHLDGRRSYDAPVVPAPPVPDTGEPGVLTLSPTGRRVRLAATAVVLALLLRRGARRLRLDAALLAAVALAACVVPARRAVRVELVEALRGE